MDLRAGEYGSHGLYDMFLELDTGDDHQSRAYGKRLWTYQPGDAATPQRAPLSEDDYAGLQAALRDFATPAHQP